MSDEHERSVEPAASPPARGEGAPATPAHAGAGSSDAAEPGAPRLPSFLERLLQVFFSPGALMAALVARPAWAVALAVAAGLVAVQTGLIPWEVYEAAQREAALQRGATPPEIPENVVQIMRWVTPVFAGVAAGVFTFVFAGLFTLIFAFVLGDEGRYTQYLAVTSHATLIPVIVGLALVPLKISQGDPQFTLNLGAFFFFLPEGYPLRVLTMLDLSQLWSMLVTAVGVRAIDPRRSFASAAAILVVVAVLVAMLFALFVPSV